jgi:sulfite oxidase
MAQSYSYSSLLVHSECPRNAEPPLQRLRSHFITAQPDFYIRCHGNIPELNETTHRLHVDGLVTRPLDLSMTELRTHFPRQTVPAVLQCAGNRRSDMLRVRPVSGDPWGAGAIGNAVWSGVTLGEVLRAAGAARSASLHVAFIACDDCEGEGEHFRYAASIPMTKALAPEVLLAYEMNGEPLSAEHGFPLRVVVPGFAGARSPKWLAGITVQDRPSDAQPQARDYKLFPPHVTKETADRDRGMTIYGMPVTAAICEPSPHSLLKHGTSTLRGYAIASGRGIARVDVSIDSGQSWRQAELENDPAAPWSWTFWRIAIDLPKGEHELTVRAWDSAGQTQPALPDDVWNFKGYLSAAWHRVQVTAT